MLKDCAESENVVSGSSVLTRDEEETSKRDEDVSSPSSCPLYRRMTSQLEIRESREVKERKLTPAVK